MAGNIKGITIEFRGDTTKLDSALRKINGETRKLDKELRAVDKALKFNPTSVELWRQKQDLLKRKISETKDKLDTLKQAQAKMDAEGVDKNSDEYKKLQREIIETESKVKTFKAQLRKVGQVNLKAASEQFKQYGEALTNAGQQMMGLSKAAGAVVVSIGALTAKSASWADDVNTMSKIYGTSTTDLQKYSAAANLVDVSTEDIAKSQTRLKKSMYSAKDGTGAAAEAYKALGVDVVDANGNLRDSDDVFQDVIKSLGSMENETERDALAMQLMGKSAQNLNPLIEDGGETYKNVADTLAKYNLDFISQEDLDAANEFNDQIDMIKTIGLVAFQSIGTQLAGYLAPALEKVVGWVGKFAEFLSGLDPSILTLIAGIAGVLSVIGPVLIVLGKVAFAISSIMTLMSTIGPVLAGIAGPVGIAIAVIGLLVAAGIWLYKHWDTVKEYAKTAWEAIKNAISGPIETVKTFLSTAWTTISTAMATAWELIKAAVKTAWNAIKFAITNPIAAAKLLLLGYLNGIKAILRAAWAAIKSTASSAWNGIKNAITKPLNSAKDKVKGIIDKLKGYFPLSIGKIFSDIKLPHFTVSGKAPFGIGGKGTKPSISIEWYKKAMNNPYVFSSPTLIGVGDAGSEVVYGKNSLMNDIAEAVAAGGRGGDIIININGANSDPREIADEVKRVLIQEVNRRRLAW